MSAHQRLDFAAGGKVRNPSGAELQYVRCVNAGGKRRRDAVPSFSPIQNDDFRLDARFLCVKVKEYLTDNMVLIAFSIA